MMPNTQETSNDWYMEPDYINDYDRELDYFNDYDNLDDWVVNDDWNINDNETQLDLSWGGKMFIS